VKHCHPADALKIVRHAVDHAPGLVDFVELRRNGGAIPKA